mgnify:CR=1 FL=1
MSSQEKETLEQKYLPILKDLVVPEATTVAAIAGKWKLSQDLILRANPQIQSATVVIQPSLLSAPCQISVGDPKKPVLLHDSLRHARLRIRPLIWEIMKTLIEFDANTRDFCEKAPSKDILTHTQIWDLNFELDKIVPPGSQKPIDIYQRGILSCYQTALTNMGFVFRDLSYLFHFCHHPEMFTVGKPDKVSDALVFSAGLCEILLGRLDDWLSAIRHNYQQLSGRIQDFTFYQAITDLIEGSFGKILPWFSTHGQVNHFTQYPENFLAVLRKDFDEGIPFGNPQDDEPASDLFIFNYERDFAGNKTTDALKKLAGDLDASGDESTKKIWDTFESRQQEATNYYLGEVFTELRATIKETSDAITSFKASHPKCHKLNMDADLQRLYGAAVESLDTVARLVAPNGVYGENEQERLARAALKTSCYWSGAGLYTLAGFVDKEVDLFDSLFMDEETFFASTRMLFGILIKAGQARDAETGFGILEDFNAAATAHREWAEALAGVTEATGLIRELLVLLALTVVTAGVGTVTKAALGGFVTGIRAASIATRAGRFAVGVGSFATEVVVFTVAMEGIDSAIEERSLFDKSISNFGSSLVSSALMFGAFRFVGRTVGILIAKGNISNALARMALQYTGNYLGLVLVGGVPLIGRLVSEGKDPFSRDEWGKFLLSQALFAGVFAVAGAMQFRLNATQKKITVNAFRVGSQLRQKWTQLDLQQRAAQIQQARQDIESVWIRLRTKYCVRYELDKKAFDSFLLEYQTAIRKGRVLYKALAELRRDLIGFEASLSKEAPIDIAPEGELRYIDHSLRMIENMIADVKYIPDFRHALAVTVHKALPNSETRGLARIGQSNRLYRADLRNILENANTLKKLQLNGEPIRLLFNLPKVPSDADERLDEGSLMVQSSTTLPDGTKVPFDITLIDSKGRNLLPLILSSPALPSPAAKHEMFDKLADAVKPQSLQELQEEFHSLSLAEVQEAIRKADPHFVLSEAQRVEAKSQQKKLPRFVARLQKTGYDPVQRPMVFVADALDLVGTKDWEQAKTIVGFPTKYIKSESDDGLWIIELKDPLELREATWENLERCFFEYLKWGRELEKWDAAGNRTPFLDCTYSDTQLRLFYSAFMEAGLERKVADSNEWKKLWSLARDRTPDENAIDVRATELRKQGLLVEQDPLWGLLFCIDKVTSTTLFSGDGYTRTFSGRNGLREYLLTIPGRKDPISVHIMNKLGVNNSKEPLSKAIGGGGGK